MKRVISAIALITLVVLLGFGSAALADTLELKDGRLVKGKYMGGTQYNIRFLVEGKLELYPVSDVLTVTLDPRPSQPAGPQPRPQVAPAQRHPSALTVPADTRSSGSSVTVPAGTRLMVRMIDGVDSDTNQVGDRFRASLVEDLIVDGVTVAPKGTDVFGRLMEVKEAGRIQGRSELSLELSDISINNQLVPIRTGDYEASGRSRGSDTAKKTVGGAAIGAVIGAIAGGGKGAAIGAGVGGAAGAGTQVFTRGEKVKVPSETVLEFTLQQPFVAHPSTTAAR